MLFNAAHKWAREDTAQVIFTYSDSIEKELEKIVRGDVMEFAKRVEVGELSFEVSKRGSSEWLRSRQLVLECGYLHSFF